MNTARLIDLLPPAVMAELQSVITRFEINTPRRLAHFLSQCGHESGGFKRTVENLNYSAEGLLRTFPRHFTTELAAQYARQPERIANRVYRSRMSNGDEASGDGWRFRGRGYIQLTGRANYTAFNRFVTDDVVANPDLVATRHPLLSAGWFWHTNKLNALADVGTVEQVTRRVNGGTHGLDDRTARFNRILPLLA